MLIFFAKGFCQRGAVFWMDELPWMGFDMHWKCWDKPGICTYNYALRCWECCYASIRMWHHELFIYYFCFNATNKWQIFIFQESWEGSAWWAGNANSYIPILYNFFFKSLTWAVVPNSNSHHLIFCWHEQLMFVIENSDLICPFL